MAMSESGPAPGRRRTWLPRTYGKVIILLAVLASMLALVAARPATAATTGWELRSNSARTANTPAVTVVGSTTYYVVQGTDNQVWWATAVTDNYRPTPGGWITPFAPTAVTFQGRLWVFIRGSNDTRIYYRQLLNATNNQWTNWTGVPGSDSIGTPAVAVMQDRLMVTYTNPAHLLRYAMYVTGSNPVGWQVTNGRIPGNGASDSPPAATAYGPNLDTVMVLHRGTNNLVYRQIWELTHDGGFWSGIWQQIGTALTTQPPALAATGPNNEIVEAAVTGTDDQVWIYQWRNGLVTQSWAPLPVGNMLIQTNRAPTLYSVALQAAIYVVVTALRAPWANTIWGKEVV